MLLTMGRKSDYDSIKFVLCGPRDKQDEPNAECLYYSL